MPSGVKLDPVASPHLDSIVRRRRIAFSETTERIHSAILVGDDLFLPYGVADSSVCFAFVEIKDILAAMA
jgi:hypothetical protein